MHCLGRVTSRGTKRFGSLLARAIDIHMQDIVRQTMTLLLCLNDPYKIWISTEPLEECLDLLPTRLIQFRIYSPDHHHDAVLSQAAATVLNKTPTSLESNY
jgi:hypothetical protein